MKLTKEDATARLAAMAAARSVPAGSSASATAAAHGDGWLSDEEYAKLSPRERAELQAKRSAKKLAELAAGDYRDWLAGLSSVVGRNNALMEGARRAKRAGVPCEAFVSDTVAAGGEPLLTEGEVRRAWQRCTAQPAAASPSEVPRYVPPPMVKPRPPSEDERGYVRRMVERGRLLLRGWNGRASDLLSAASPVAVPADRQQQAVAQLVALFGKSPGKVYLGAKYEARDPSKLQPLDVWLSGIEEGAPLPPLAGLHTFTGQGVAVTDEKTGEVVSSFRHGDAVAAWSYALVEFDDLRLVEQVAFWLGVLDTGTLDVRTITFTGGKSLHGCIRVETDGSRAAYRRIWGKVAKLADGQRDEERTTWGPLSRLLCSDPEAVEETGAEGKTRTAYPYCVDFGASSVLTTRLAGCAAHVETKANGERKSYGDARLLWVARTEAEKETKPAEQEAVAAARRCADCPADTSNVCRRVFGSNWEEKSNGGCGCNFPVDGIAKAWKTLRRKELPPRPLSDMAKRALDFMADKHGPSWDKAREYVRWSSVVPDWLVRRMGI